MPRSKKTEESETPPIKKRVTKKSPSTKPTRKKPTSTAKSKTTTKKPVPKKQEKVVQEELPKQPPKFHEVFPIKLEHKDKRLNEKKTCYFQCKEHLDSYLKRYKLKKTEYQISDTEER